jgi:hypothetical protein
MYRTPNDASKIQWKEPVERSIEKNPWEDNIEKPREKFP